MAKTQNGTSTEVLTNRKDEYRSSLFVDATAPPIEKVNVTDFGKLFSRTVDGDLYAQPLIAEKVRVKPMFGQEERVRDAVVYLATSRNWVYAYDAEDPDEPLPLWQTNLGTPVSRENIKPGYTNFAAEIGITGTPVIEKIGKGGTIYVVAKTQARARRGFTFAYHIHALDILTGKVIRSQVISAFALTGAAQRIEFDAKMHLNRPGLLLLDGVIYIAFGSHGDYDPFYGWVLAYGARDLAQLAAHCTSPDWGQGGIWHSGTGLAGDSDGYVYYVSGNGLSSTSGNKGLYPRSITFAEIQTMPHAFGCSIVKLKLVKASVPNVKTAAPAPTPKSKTASAGTRARARGQEPDRMVKAVSAKNAPARQAPRASDSYRFVVESFYTPSHAIALNMTDDDLCGGPVLFDASGPHGDKKNLAMGGGKNGFFYVLDRTNLGGYVAPKVTPTQSSDRNSRSTGMGHAMTTGTGGPFAHITGNVPGHVLPVPPNTDGITVEPLPNLATLQEEQLCTFHIHGAPVFWEGAPHGPTAYVWAEKDRLKALLFSSGRFQTPPYSDSAFAFPSNVMRMPGGFLAVSAKPDDPNNTGIVWAAHPADADANNATVRGILRAFDAKDLKNELWDSDHDPSGADRLGDHAKFCPPVIHNGKVYMATFSRELVVYGELPKSMRRPQDLGGWTQRTIWPRQRPDQPPPPPPVIGSASVSCGRFTILGSGSDIGGTDDGFEFVFQTADSTRRITITARVLSIQNTSPLAKAGVMIRQAMMHPDQTDSGMPHVTVALTPATGAVMLYRTAPAGPTFQYPGPNVQPPYWVRMVSEMVGNQLQLTGFISESGHEETWNLIGHPIVLDLNGQVLSLEAGMAVTAHSQAAANPQPAQMLNQSTFDHVEVDS
jgi:hypothetical protein